MNRISILITSTAIMSGIGGLLASPVLSGMMMFFFITVMALSVHEALTLLFGDRWL